MSCLSLFSSNELGLYLVQRPINTEEGSHNKVIILVLIFCVDCCLGQWGSLALTLLSAQQVGVYSVVINTEHIVNISCHLPAVPEGNIRK